MKSEELNSKIMNVEMELKLQKSIMQEAIDKAHTTAMAEVTGRTTSEYRINQLEDRLKIFERLIFGLNGQSNINKLSAVEMIITDPRLNEYENKSNQTSGSAGMDLRAFWPGNIAQGVIAPGEQVMLDSGLKIWIKDKNYVGLLFPRSSSGVKGLVLGNGTGVIDSDYQGPLKLCLLNRSDREIVVESGDRVAQLVIVPVGINFKINTVNEFTNSTDRGAGGFGHTGVK